MRKMVATALGQIGDARALAVLREEARKDKYRSDPDTAANEIEAAISSIRKHQKEPDD